MQGPYPWHTCLSSTASHSCPFTPQLPYASMQQEMHVTRKLSCINVTKNLYLPAAFA